MLATAGIATLEVGHLGRRCQIPGVLPRNHRRDLLIFSVIQSACDISRALHRSRNFAASCGSIRTVIASLGVSLGLRPAPSLDPPRVGFMSIMSCALPHRCIASHIYPAMAHLDHRSRKALCVACLLIEC